MARLTLQIVTASTTQLIIEATASSEEIRLPLAADADARRIAAAIADRFKCRVRVEQVQVYGPTSHQIASAPPSIGDTTSDAPPQEKRLNAGKAPDVILNKMRDEPQRVFRVDDLIDPDRGLDKRLVAAALYRLWKTYELVEQVSRGKFRARMEVKSE